MVKKTSIQAILEGHVCAPGHRLYIVRDGPTVFYVGQSVDPPERVRGHLGLGELAFGGRDRLGYFIVDNLPEAQAWQVVLYTLEDCQAYLGAWDVDDAEQRLIDLARPALNVQGNRDPMPIPAKYKQSWNELIRLREVDG